MRQNRFALFALLLMAAGFAVFWGVRREATSVAPSPAPVASAIPTGAPAFQLATTQSAIAQSGGASTNQAKPARADKSLRLTNTDLEPDKLARSESAILLRNAFFDTAVSKALDIPEHLKAGENPGSYIVQAKGTANSDFQTAVERAGGKLVAYVPNNAFLVSASAEVAEALNNVAEVRAVQPFEPYYKVDSRLLAKAVRQEPLAAETWLRVTFFEGADASNLGPLAQEIGATEPSPFGPQTLVLPVPNGLVELARRPDVQMIEPWTPRVLANDLTRVRIGVSADTITNRNWLDLTGTNVWVNLNDVGVDGTHRDLQGRVFYQGTNATVDLDGHGTHVAATIIGFPGTNVFPNFARATNNTPERSTMWPEPGMIDGSFTNASFRGIAHEAQLFVLPVAFAPGVNNAPTDTYLIETAAATNYLTLDREETLISNNSWNYANSTDYDSQAARFDAATRDALGEVTGSQPVAYVFAAGNYGFGAEDGFGGEPGFISSPGTAKNVITVGALETPRFLQVGLTNIFETYQTNGSTITTNTITNVVRVFEATTDSDDQVAAFSSRGNVAPLIEGQFGRFKPDLVAPGTFTISAASSRWNITNDFPQYVASSNYYHTMTNLNGVFATNTYRYDAGTSFSAPAVSGLLALVQEFFSTKLDTEKRRNLSPALMKALLINGARSVSGDYDINPNTLINYQGWGLVDIRRILPTNLVAAPTNRWPIQLIDQNPTNAVATGERRTWKITLDTNAVTAPLRVTLVWTDPPGNPAVAAKLVNDLDLVIETDDGQVFHGNDILEGRNFTEARREVGAPFGNSGYRDYINNVENIIIQNPIAYGTNFSIHVLGRRVNVKAVNDYYQATSRRNEIVQDYALVVSSDHTLVDQAFTKFEWPTTTENFSARNLQTITNGVPMLYQRVGANSALSVSTNGVPEQWNFYVFTNSPANQTTLNAENIGKNVAFVTFTPPNLSLARALEADIDVYVSTNIGLLDLDPAVVNGAWKSVSQGGTEAVVFATNAVPNNISIAYPYAGDPSDTHIFYVAVKSEDQQAAEFSLMGVSTDRPFEEERNGKRILNVVPISQYIPDGVPNRPQAGIGFAIGLSDRRVLNASAYMTLTHEEAGDLVGIVSHRNRTALLNNHTLFDDTFTGRLTVHFNDFFYRSPFPNLADYAPGDPIPDDYLYTDGPGFLEDYAGFKMQGPWMVHMIDNAATHVGRIDKMELQVEPIRDDLFPGLTVDVQNFTGQTFFPIDVPPNASKMTITLKRTTGTVPLEMLVRRDLIPTTNDFDFRAVTVAPSDTAIITVTKNSQPPLIPGEYIVGVINNSATPVNFSITVTIELDEFGADQIVVGESNVDLSDDARTISRRDVTEDKIVAEAAVAIVAQHARVSDLALRLISPQGTRIVLSENRGGFSPDGFGSTNQVGSYTNFSYAVFTDDPVARWPIKFTPPPFGDSSASRGVLFGYGFEGETERNLAPGTTFGPGGAWTVLTNRVTIVTSPASAEGTNYINLNNGGITRLVPTTAGRTYRLSFKYRANPAVINRISPAYSTGLLDHGALQNQQAADLHYRLVSSGDPSIAGTDLFVAATNAPPFPVWMANDATSQWISPSPTGDSGHPQGDYTMRTSFIMNGWTQPILRLEAAADDAIRTLRFNGALVNITASGPGAFSPPLFLTPIDGLNTLDFNVVIGQNPSPLGLRTRFALQGGTAPANASIGNVAIFNGASPVAPTLASVTGTGEWLTHEMDFVANTNSTRLTFASPFAPGLEVDDILLEDSGTVFIMPEEPLSTLEGQRAMGEWRLEAWDNRTGAPVPANIVDWQLILSTADAPRAAEKLNSGRIYPTVAINNPRIRAATNVYSPGVLNRREVEWFYFDPCADSTFARITVFTSRTNQFGRVQLLVDRSGFPTGDPETDDYEVIHTITNLTSITTEFTVTSPAAAPLQPGRRMFFALRNESVFNTNRFAVRVDYNGQCAFTPPPPLPTNAPFSYVTPSRETAPNGDSFTASTPSAASIDVAIAEGGGDVTIYATRNGEPSPTNFEVRQRITGTSGTVQLPGAGEWTIRLDNEGSEPVFYDLTLNIDLGIEIQSTAIVNGKFQVTWQSVAGRAYEVSTSTDLVNWSAPVTVEATSATTTYTDSQDATGRARFYRIQRAD